MMTFNTEILGTLSLVYPWSPDQGDGIYCNPVLAADYSDPDVIRHGEKLLLGRL